MKSAFTTFLIISFIGVAVFGFVSMIYGAEHGMGCIASALQGTTLCPLGNAFAFVVFHLEAFKYFSTAVLAGFAAFVIAMALFSLLPKPLSDEDDEDAAFIFEKVSEPYTGFKERLNRWLSLHVNSPAFAAAAI